MTDEEVSDMDWDGVVPHGAGWDVHKKVIVATVLTPTITATRSFGTLPPDLLALADWLQACGVTPVAREATGVYGKPVVNLLEAYDFQAVMVVNPQHIQGMPGRKTDVHDSPWIAGLLRMGALKARYIPPRPQRELRGALSYAGLCARVCDGSTIRNLGSNRQLADGFCS